MSKPIFLRFPNGKGKAFTLSYDDGVEQDVQLMSIFDKYNLKATFNINSGSFAAEGEVFAPGNVHRHLTKAATLKTYTDCGHEVALHTYDHPHLECMTTAQIAWEVVKDREVLEDMFKMPIRGLAYPYGTYNDTVVEALRACGVVYARTTAQTEKFELPTDWLRLASTCRHRSPKLMELGEKFVNLNVNNFSTPKLFYLWGHSYEFEEDNNWDYMDKFCELIGNRDDIWYATNIEIYEYIEAYNRLVWSAASTYVYNPTSITVFFMRCNKLYEVKAGETVAIED